MCVKVSHDGNFYTACGSPLTYAAPWRLCLTLSLACCQQPQQQKQFAINFCTTSYRTEMEAKHCLEKIFSGPPLQH